MALYLLTGMIRLAYFNVTEEERQKSEEGVRKYYLGLPVTSAAIIFPSIMVVQYLSKAIWEINISPLYFIGISFCAVAFVTKFQLKKPSFKTLCVFVAIGVAEVLLMVFAALVL